MNSKKLISDEVMRECADGYELIGEKCADCGCINFPPRGFCTQCLSEHMEKVPLSKKGILYSYTVARMPTIRFDAPWAMGYVDLPEGVRVFAPIRGHEDHKYEIGEEMELEFFDAWRETDAEQNEVPVTAYRFVSTEAKK